jgi:hypothetical protein
LLDSNKEFYLLNNFISEIFEYVEEFSFDWTSRIGENVLSVLYDVLGSGFANYEGWFGFGN